MLKSKQLDFKSLNPSQLWTDNSFYWVKNSFYINFKSKPQFHSSIIFFVYPVISATCFILQQRHYKPKRPTSLNSFQLKEHFSHPLQIFLSNRLLQLRLFHGKQVPQVDLRVNIMRDLPLVEESRQVGLDFGAAWHSHAQGKEATQVFLHKGKMVSIQALLPRLLWPVTFLLARRNHQNTQSGRVASHHFNMLKNKPTTVLM